MIWGLILGLHFATQTSELPPRALHYIAKSLFALWLISITIMVSQLVGNLVRHYGGRSNGQMPATSLTKSLAQIFVAVIGLLILLNHLGISITPLLATLGVGGLAVALALQDTLSNLFAGFYISIAGQVRLPEAIALAVGAVGGARVGAGLLSRLGDRPLKLAFGSFLIAVAVLMAVRH